MHISETETDFKGPLVCFRKKKNVILDSFGVYESGRKNRGKINERKE